MMQVDDILLHHDTVMSCVTHLLRIGHTLSSYDSTYNEVHNIVYTYLEPEYYTPEC